MSKLTRTIEEKIEHLQELLREYEKVGVAFSGGVDSSVLLHTACRSLEKSKIVAMQAISCLHSRQSAQQAQILFTECFSQSSTHRVIEVHPLQWKEFVANTEERCYFCKRRMYALMKNELEGLGGGVLVDGTNVDDLKDKRPGLRAIHELSVKTPLLDVGLSKSEIRLFAQAVGLPNHDLPSNSCLATRIGVNRTIRSELLAEIETAEDFMHELGFAGCRVRPQHDKIVVEVLHSDLERFVARPQRVAIVHYFRNRGYTNVYLDVTGRSNH